MYSQTLQLRISFFLNSNQDSDLVIHESDYILKNIDEGNLTGAVFLNLSTAFDMIDHSLLKIKLNALGVRGRALAWFDNRPFSKMAAKNLNKSKLETNTSTRKSILNLVTLPSFSIG